jgi:hypothetical protein
MAVEVMYAVASSLPEQAEDLLQEVLSEAELSHPLDKDSG